MSAKRLTPKERIFVSEYIKTRNGSEAARIAGYSPLAAKEIACRMLTKAHIRAEIDARIEKIQEKAEVSAEWVLVRLKEVARRCLQEVPVMEFDHEAKTMVQKVDEQGRGVWEFDSSGANKSLELLGKTIRMFVDKIEHSGDIKISEAVKEGRERLNKASQT